MNNYGWSSLMIKFNKAIDSQIISFANKFIPAECQSDPANGSGIVTDPHISIITDLEISYPALEVRKNIEQLAPFNVSFGPISFFRNDHVDVIKIDIISDELNTVHYHLKNIIPNHYKFDEYHPHCTLAFVKPGTCDGILNQANYFRGMTYQVNWINYNSAMGVAHSIKIGKNN